MHPNNKEITSSSKLRNLDIGPVVPIITFIDTVNRDMDDL